MRTTINTHHLEAYPFDDLEEQRFWRMADERHRAIVEHIAAGLELNRSERCFLAARLAELLDLERAEVERWRQRCAAYARGEDPDLPTPADLDLDRRWYHVAPRTAYHREGARLAAQWAAAERLDAERRKGGRTQ
jgi:hypothetical protein